jgi:hypothetical protein
MDRAEDKSKDNSGDRDRYESGGEAIEVPNIYSSKVNK